ncbi:MULTISPECIES: GNAT family N-acetyltransferase [Micrococcaceae]|nr:MULTISPECIES: GNAT family N-acetyltransferase [Pseudarthrobacter]MEA3552428.1 GNAT family N-acetyltransferase [Pseudarthrobacter sp. C1]WPU10099.1 GNAT family N-acetyltransferase [Pseudarthrobacter oxydans]HET7782160.1 GNAT family N-acetyltransferase [Arthrobacter sp.]
MEGTGGRGLVAMALEVRRAAASDVERLAEVHVLCWQETYRGMLSDGFLASQKTGSRLQLWRHLLEAAEPAHAWVASDGGTVVGFAGIRREPGAASHGFAPPSSGDLELWGLYLLASHQGLGLGRRLLAAALGNEAASLWVAADNQRAIGFYRHFGFEPDGAADVIPGWEDLREIRMVRGGQPPG